ncbi:hypothetical protein, partial [Enterococcus casseliflavus]|uniref:hypothetical protein n=1 Tax=Enterococcus casseliflavus TaxID=37734 RepID=UPI003D0DBEE4
HDFFFCVLAKSKKMLHVKHNKNKRVQGLLAFFCSIRLATSFGTVFCAKVRLSSFLGSAYNKGVSRREERKKWNRHKKQPNHQSKQKFKN